MLGNGVGSHGITQQRTHPSAQLPECTGAYAVIKVSWLPDVRLRPTKSPLSLAEDLIFCLVLGVLGVGVSSEY